MHVSIQSSTCPSMHLSWRLCLRGHFEQGYVQGNAHGKLLVESTILISKWGNWGLGQWGKQCEQDSKARIGQSQIQTIWPQSLLRWWFTLCVSHQVSKLLEKKSLDLRMWTSWCSVCLEFMKSWVWTPVLCKLGVVVYTCIPCTLTTLWRWSREDQKFMVILGYIMNSRPVWITWETVSKQNKWCCAPTMSWAVQKARGHEHQQWWVLSVKAVEGEVWGYGLLHLYTPPLFLVLTFSALCPGPEHPITSLCSILQLFS